MSITYLEKRIRYIERRDIRRSKETVAICRTENSSPQSVLLRVQKNRSRAVKDIETSSSAPVIVASVEDACPVVWEESTGAEPMAVEEDVRPNPVMGAEEIVAQPIVFVGNQIRDLAVLCTCRPIQWAAAI